jgi:hypothetical protein
VGLHRTCMLRESLLCSSPLALHTKLDRELATAVWDETLNEIKLANPLRTSPAERRTNAVVSSEAQRLTAAGVQFAKGDTS